MARMTTLKQRFLFIVVPILLVVTLVVVYAQQLVDRTARESLRSISLNTELSWQVQQIQDIEQDLELLVNQYTLITYSGDPAIISAIDWTRRHLLERITLLEKTLRKPALRDKIDETYLRLVTLLQGQQRALHVLLDRYHGIIQDRARRFPALNLLQTHLLPANHAFMRAVALALNEYEARPLTVGEYEVVSLLKDLRYAWMQQESWLRLFIANQSVIFGSSTATNQDLETRRRYVAMVEQKLRRLEDLRRAGRLYPEVADSLTKMRQAFRRYERHFQRVQALYRSGKWRTDHAMLINVLQPAFRELHGILNRFEKRLRQTALENIKQSNAVAARLTRIIWLSVLVVLCIVGIGYFMFEHLVRRPVTQIADALHAEAEGQTDVTLPETRVRETAMLVEAFRYMRAEVHSRQIRLQSVLDNAAEGIVTFDQEGQILSCNRAAERLFGEQEASLIGRSLLRLVEANSPELLFQEGEYEVRARSSDGREFPMAIKISRYQLDGKALFTAMLEDISERHALIENLRHLAEHDTLTGLYNRHYFMQELERLVERIARHPQETAALMYLDLDNFKYVNDTLGHMAGDQLLLEVSTMLSKRCRHGDLLARLGGDEFALLLYDIDADDAWTVADVYRRYLQDYDFRYQGQVIDIAGSIGLVIIDGSHNKEELLARADFACHAAKMAGKNRVHLYTEADEEGMIGLVDDIGWTRRIKNALENDLFVLACQPIVDREGVIRHQEILLRMYGEGRQIIQPAGFIPPAERFGLMPDIDRWVIRHALALITQQEPTAEPVQYCINLSAASFEDRTLIDFITRELMLHEVPPQRLIFEITETVAMADLSATAGFLHRLQELGCQTALDDFGTGYSSYAYLKDLPVDYVKIDGSFVCGMADNALHREIVQSMHNIAHIMGKQTIAEFVETEAVARLLREIGVDYLQGYHIGRPEIPAAEQARIRQQAET